jgi:hypothetical protein
MSSRCGLRFFNLTGRNSYRGCAGDPWNTKAKRLQMLPPGGLRPNTAFKARNVGNLVTSNVPRVDGRLFEIG